MKIYTITCHNVYNHGASLQAYALMKFLLTCGHEVEIIDYRPKYLNNHYNLLNVDNPKWERNIILKWLYLMMKFPLRLIGLKRKKAFDSFTFEFLKLTKNIYTTNDELRNLPIVDAYICGSDQIWNSLFENGKDPAFYLDFAPKEKLKLSYAASFATDFISNNWIPFVKKRVKELDGIGVRETSAVDILNKMNISKAVTVVDPTLLLSKHDWNIISKRKFKQKYILIYDFEKSNLIERLATELAREKGYKIYSINPVNIKYAHKQFKYVGPEVFISLVRDAQFIFSNSFHAAVFSVIFKKNFAIVNRTENINTRMRDFLTELKLNDRLVQEDRIITDILKPIDYNEVVEIIDTKINFSKSYLENLLTKKRVKDAL
ncbi:polysaccharide pyruvyl transferase family protein [Jeotgalibacillus proteolyticus]|uniref:Polysaccharide pyruvyl transferase family protein n=1 Tax=Jeotgalibacillus proteolyticus TaxID=2082395 RepID=A0A2S5G8B8_9BACL|nr:polysaccharide pyruvyl transferase family protein [Jeotgalibacillus proteolyticus]PPA69230.1 polysaccharide pyruvyl transferase family protein [Jeotgalibacillus proteolyticus]